MFIMKFMRCFDNGNSVTTVISTGKYDVYSSSDGGKLVLVDGYEYKLTCSRDVLGDMNEYHQVYVENSEGKTVDLIRSKGVL